MNISQRAQPAMADAEVPALVRRRGELSPRAFTIAQILIIAAVLVLGIAVRVASQVDAVPEETGFGAYVDWGTYWLLRTNHLYHTGDVSREAGKSVALMPYATGISYGKQDIFAKTLNGTIARITGYDDLANRIRVQWLIPWAGAIFLPLSILILYASLHRPARPSLMDLADRAVIALFATLPSAVLINQSTTGGYGDIVARGLMYTLISLLVLRALRQGKTTLPEAISFVIILAGFQLMYHTPVLYFLVIAAVFVLATGLLSRRLFTMGNVVFLALIAAVAAHLYINTDFFNDYLGLIKQAFGKAAPANTQPTLVSVFPDRSHWISYLNVLILGATIALACLVLWRTVAVLRRHAWRDHGGLHPDVVIGVLLMTALPLAPFLYGFQGLGAIYGRLGTVLPILVAMALGYLLATPTRRWERYGIYLLVMLIAGASIVSFKLDFYNAVGTITPAEAQGNAYLASVAATDDLIFTDFRMGTPLLYRGLYGITGINSGYIPADQARALEQSVYGDGSGTAAIQALDKAVSCRCYYLMTSEQQARIGVSDLGVLFGRAAPTFQQKFISSEALDILYTNGEVNVFRRTDGSRNR